MAFVPLAWQGSLDDFDAAVDRQVAFFSRSSQIDSYVELQVVKLHEIMPGALDDITLDEQVVNFGARRVAADVYIGMTNGDLALEGNLAARGWVRFGSNGLVLESNYTPVLSHEMGHIFSLCDEYNYFHWSWENDLLPAGCPNPYPPQCPKCTEGVCCPGHSTKDGATCLLGENTQTKMYCVYCTTHLDREFSRRFEPPIAPPTPPPPPPTATPSPIPTHLPQPTATSSPTPVPPTARAVSFISDRDGKLRLYSLDLNTAQQTRIPVNIEGNIYHTAWSPDGSRLAVAAGTGTNLEIFLWDEPSGQLTQLTNNLARDEAPAWSPDGTQIAFVSNRDGNRELYLWDLPTGAQIRLTQTDLSENSPAWSPNGDYLAYVANEGIYVAELRANMTLAIPQMILQGEAVQPAWSPHGKWIAFAASRARYWDIHLIEVQTRRVERLTYGGAHHLAPEWLSADELVIQTNRGEDWEIYTMARDGTQLRALTTDVFDNNQPKIIR